MGLLPDTELERSPVVANCRMNRERTLVGSNGYARDLGFSPLDFLRARIAETGHASWLDLCCGTGKALIEAARLALAEGLDSRIEIVGVDLVGGFGRPDPHLNGLQLVTASLSTWRPRHGFDLITCIHGLHYLGDKLEVIARAASWLVEDGRFVSHIDLANLKFANGGAAGRRILSDLRQAGLEYDRVKRLILCQGQRFFHLPYHYLGADDQAGPNFTGQPAVDSYYQPRQPSLG